MHLGPIHYESTLKVLGEVFKMPVCVGVISQEILIQLAWGVCDPNAGVLIDKKPIRAWVIPVCLQC